MNHISLFLYSLFFVFLLDLSFPSFSFHASSCLFFHVSPHFNSFFFISFHIYVSMYVQFLFTQIYIYQYFSLPSSNTNPQYYFAIYMYCSNLYSCFPFLTPSLIMHVLMSPLLLHSYNHTPMFQLSLPPITIYEN